MLATHAAARVAVAIFTGLRILRALIDRRRSGHEETRCLDLATEIAAHACAGQAIPSWQALRRQPIERPNVLWSS
jgi:hypothetical protein